MNWAFEFKRPQAMGMHLNIPAGTSVRFEPGQVRVIEPVYGGGKDARDGRGLMSGATIAQGALNQVIINVIIIDLATSLPLTQLYFLA